MIGCLFWTVGCATTSDNNGSSHLLNKIKQQEIKDELQQHIEDYQSVKPSIERLVELESDLRILVAQIAALQQSPETIVQEDVSKAATQGIPDINDLDLAKTTIDSENNSADVVQLKPQKADMPEVNAIPMPKISTPVEAIQLPKETVSNVQMAFVKPNISTKREDSGSEQQPTSNSQFGLSGDYAQCEPLGAQPNANYFAVHISSFNRADLVVKGWNDAVQTYPELCQKSGVIQRIHIKNKLFYSLRVGPYIEKDSAKAFCKQIRANKQYCRVTDFTGQRL